MSESVKILHNMLVRAEVGGVEQWVKASTETAVSFFEGTENSTPMAFTFRRQPERSPLKIRYDRDGNRLFMRMGTVKSILSTERAYCDYRYPTYAIINANDRKAMMMHNSNERIGGHEFGSMCRLESLRSPNKHDVQEGYRAFEQCVSEWMIMEGCFWKAIPEPVFGVYRTNEGWKTVLSPTVDGRLGHDRKHFHFGLGQYEELISWKEHLAHVTQRPATEDEFVSMEVYEPHRDGYRIDLQFLLADVLTRFKKAEDPLWGIDGKALDYVSMPMPLLDLFHRTRTLEAAAHADWSDDLAASIVRLGEDISEFVSENPKYKALFAKPSENDMHLEKWFSRPIGLAVNIPNAMAP